MSSTSKRAFAAIISTAALGATIGITAAPAGARVTAANTEFCVIVSDPGINIDFDGLGPEEAEYAAGLMRDAAKTDVPSKLKKDLLKLAKVYDRIADGEPSVDVIASKQTFVNKALTRFSKYTAQQCITTPES